MKKNKTILDREPVSSDYIASHQNFGQVINQVNQLSVPVWKTGWFYGPIGMAVVAVVVSIATIDPASAESTAVSTSIASTSFKNSLVDQVEHPPTRMEEVELDEAPTPSPVVAPAPQVNQSSPVTVVQVQEVTPEAPVRVDVTPSVTTNTGKKNVLPHIGNYFLGEIPVADLTMPLECNEDIRIIAFNVHFNTTNGTETASIIGNKVPQKIVDVIKAHNIGYMVSFTDIKGKTSEGKVVSLLPMNFVATNTR